MPQPRGPSYTIALRPVKPAVYLDEMAWISLARAHYGKDSAWQDAHDSVADAKAAAACMFPLSMSHFYETCKRTNDRSRTELIEYMATIWGADTMLPWMYMARPEARNAVLASQGLPIVDVRSYLFGKGASYAFGMEPKLTPPKGKTPNYPEGMIEDIEAKLRGADLLPLFADKSISDSFRRMFEGQPDVVTELQAAVDRDYAHQDKATRHRIAEANFMMYTAGDFLLGALSEMLPDQTAMRAWMDANLTSQAQIRQVLTWMPTLKTFWTLSHHRNKTRQVAPNDVWDMALAAAIPYSEIVFTEKAWCNVATREGIASTYGTTMVHKPDDLAQAVRKLVPAS